MKEINPLFSRFFCRISVQAAFFIAFFRENTQKQAKTRKKRYYTARACVGSRFSVDNAYACAYGGACAAASQK